MHHCLPVKSESFCRASSFLYGRQNKSNDNDANVVNSTCHLLRATHTTTNEDK